MSAPSSYDAIVIGGGVSGLVAASYFAKARKKVLLLEEKDWLGGRCARASSGDGPAISTGPQTLHALDPLVVRDLNLLRRGLRFAGRELPLVGVRADGKPIILSRNIHDTAASILPHSSADAAQWPRFRNELFELARAMRPLWWESRGALPEDVKKPKIERIARMGASAWLDTWFESEVLKAALCFDATAGGLSLAEPGSALSLLWRAAQEMSGLQNAVVVPAGGMTAFVEILVAAAKDAGCDLRTGAEVVAIILDDNRVAGVRLHSGESCFAPVVFSTAGLNHTASGLLPPGAFGFARSADLCRISPLAEARVTLVLSNKPQLGAVPSACRFVVAEKTEAYLSAELAARNGAIGDELPVEFVIPTVADSSLAPLGQHFVFAHTRPVPRSPADGWASLRPVLAAKVIAALDKVMPNLSRDVSRVEVLTPDDVAADAGTSATRLLMSTADRVQTPISGLFLCGADAEPVSAISGRAARIAAGLAIRS
jgi:phytoene dehydrogenase-like protein